MSKHKVFYSFHHKEDNWRVAQVRNIGAIEGNKPISDNDWETVKRGGDKAIKRWIDDQLHDCSCTLVLVGQQTPTRRWIDYEIEASWNRRMGVVGIHIHMLKDSDGFIARKGSNPFDHFKINKVPFSKIVRCYNPPGITSRQAYSWIARYLPDAIEEAMYIRGRHGA